MKDTITSQYMNFVKKHNRIPKYFNPYNCSELTDYSQAITAACGVSTLSAALYVFEVKKE